MINKLEKAGLSGVPGSLLVGRNSGGPVNISGKGQVLYFFKFIFIIF